MRGPVHGTKDARKVAIGSGVGAVIETYDFIGFGTAAALYFGHAFFPGASPLAGTLASFATLGVGFAARPLGGILGGHLGDKVGRKPVLVASLIVMGLATFVIGLLPTYAAVGIFAPILLVTVRIIQGIAFGAEWGGAILMSYEHAPWRQKGRYTGMVQAGFPVGSAAGQPGVFGQRAPARRLGVAGAVPGQHRAGHRRADHPRQGSRVTGVRGRQGARRHRQVPDRDGDQDDWRNIVRGIGLRIAETAGYAVSITYMISYLKNDELATKSETLTALCIASAVGIFATMAWARLTDKIGRRTVYLYTCAFAVPFGVLMFLLVNTGIFLLIIATFVLAYCVVQNSMAGAQGAWFPELFTANTRASGASLAYQISAMVSGFTPFITTLLFVSFGWIGPALLFSTLRRDRAGRPRWSPGRPGDRASGSWPTRPPPRSPTRPTCSSPQ